MLDVNMCSVRPSPIVCSTYHYQPYQQQYVISIASRRIASHTFGSQDLRLACSIPLIFFLVKKDTRGVRPSPIELA